MTTSDGADLGDLPLEELRRHLHTAADLVADYLGHVGEYRVVPDVEPGFLRRQQPAQAPSRGEPMETILEDYRRLVEPNVTHWQHPGFLAYFNSTASGPAILGEMFAAALNSNVMFWRNAPASTELEEVVVDWLRRGLGLPDAFDGMLTDTASTSTLTALIAARQAIPGLEPRDLGLAGRAEVGALRLYCSSEAHSSVEKAAVVAGLGRHHVVRIDADDQYRLQPALLEQAIAADRDAGLTPCMIVATLGSTSSTSIDPVTTMSEIAEREEVWLHVDAAYAGSAALDPEMRPLLDGWQKADSIVVNPHKWMFTPVDASLLLYRRPEVFRQAFSLVPEYLDTRKPGQAHDYHEFGIPLGRRFRALKLWMVLRSFGLDGLGHRIRHHCRMAREIAETIAATDGWELLAPVPFSTLCFRHHPGGLDGADLDAHNQEILDKVNRDGRVFLSSTRLKGRFALRLTIGSPRTTFDHVELAWQLLRQAAG